MDESHASDRDRDERAPSPVSRRELGALLLGGITALGAGDAAARKRRKTRKRRRQNAKPQNRDARSVASTASTALEFRFALAWGDKKESPWQDLRLDDPLGIVPGRGGVLVVDSGHGRIMEYSFRGSWTGDLGSVGVGDGQFHRPTAIAVADDNLGGIFVADAGNARIQQFTSTRRFVNAWGGHGEGPGRFDRPLGIAVQPGGEVFVSDADHHCIQKFLRDGRFVAMWGEEGDGPGQFESPAGLAHSQPILGNDRLYVADSGNHRIQVFDHFGGYVTQWGRKGQGDGEFDDPYGIAIDRAGLVYVTDADNHRVQVFTAEGEFLTTFGSKGNGPGEFNHPAGITVDGGSVFVCDADNNRIQRFDRV